MNEFLEVYKQLLKDYGPQGWWPLLSAADKKSASKVGYHPGDYSFPTRESDIFEICVGAILTQNTSWKNVEKAILNLKRLGALNPEKILRLKEYKIASAIRPAGYFNQKARKLIEFSRFFIKLRGRIPSRDELLSVWGVGKETADSILLYAYKQRIFVVDAYTRRIFSRLGLISQNAEYDEVREKFESCLPKKFEVYQEFHALIVEHAKRFCQKVPKCSNCSLRLRCAYCTAQV
ncbi:MAG: endonuclease III domain-containing protein [Candidatus Woesearchaeota archaeon]